MSKVRTALRLCTVAALRNRTWAGIRVVDSNNDPIDQTVITSPMPYIVVFTDDDIHECGGSFELGNSSRMLKLIIEFGMAHPIEKAEGASPVSIPTATGENFEASLDNIEAQIERALGRDHQSLFGVLWNNFVTGMDVVGSLRAGSLEKTSVRWAARQKTYNLGVILDPVAGQPVTASHPLRKFVTAARMWTDLVPNQAAVDLIETCFNAWAVEAGLPERCTPHGLRKAFCRRLANQGKTPHEIAACTGHKTLAEVERYCREFDRERAAERAMAA